MAPLHAKKTARASAELDAATYSAKSEPVPLFFPAFPRTAAWRDVEQGAGRSCTSQASAPRLICVKSVSGSDRGIGVAKNGKLR